LQFRKYVRRDTHGHIVCLHKHFPPDPGRNRRAIESCPFGEPAERRAVDHHTMRGLVEDAKWPAKMSVVGGGIVESILTQFAV
jgi:hypothetical protein